MESRRWSELPPDLLIRIRLKLPLNDLRFASVCRSWASAASELRRLRFHRRLRRPQAPWLMFVDPSDPGAAKFCSVSEKKFYILSHQPEPQISGRLFFGSAYGWLVTVDERSEPLLLNPITRKQIPLPSVTTLPHVEPIRRSDGSLTGYTCWEKSCSLDGLRLVLYDSVILSALPESGNCIAVLLFNYGFVRNVAFARPSCERWTVLGSDEHVMNVAFHNGLLYSLNSVGGVSAYDLHSSFGVAIKVQSWAFLSYVPSGDYPSEDYPSGDYLVKVPSGDLLTVCRVRDYDYDRNAFRTVCVRLFRIDFSGRRLVELQNLRDYSIFVGGNAAVCLSTRDFLGLRKNCIYFTDERIECNQNHRDHHRDIGIYSLEDRSVEPIFRSDTRLYWPPPIWFVPNLV